MRGSGTLSGGEQQRVLIAHALIGDPGCCCSTSRSRTSTCAAARRSSRCSHGSPREQQIAILISAHEMNPLLPVMDRIVYLAAGRAASGTVEEVVRTPVLSALYGHHVDVLQVHGRVLVVAGEAGELAGCERSHAHAHPGRDHPVSGALAAIFAPGFFEPTRRSSPRSSAAWLRSRVAASACSR